MGFFSVPGLPGWSFQQRIHGGKDSTLPPVTSKKSIVFLGMMKIAGFFKGPISIVVNHKYKKIKEVCRMSETPARF